jgi:N-acyl-D-amino-acid deacylase
MVATNGSGYSQSHASSGEIVHPRSFGTFLKVLSQYVKDEGILKWEEAVRKMTGFPAEKFGLDGRGKIAKKYFADIIVIDPQTIASPASKESPYQYSRGIETMVVNGQVVMKDGKVTGKRSGKILRS